MPPTKIIGQQLHPLALLPSTSHQHTTQHHLHTHPHHTRPTHPPTASMSGAGAGAGAGSKGPETAIDVYTRAHGEYEEKRQYHMELVQKVEKLHGDESEHMVVIRALEAVPADRKAFSLVGGVLVERTAGDVIPQLQTNLHGVRCAARCCVCMCMCVCGVCVCVCVSPTVCVVWCGWRRARVRGGCRCVQGSPPCWVLYWQRTCPCALLRVRAGMAGAP